MQENIRFIVVQTRREDRTDGVAQTAKIYTVDLGKHQFGINLKEALKHVKPIFERKYSRVFNAHQILEALLKHQ